jgi:Chromo (CHRromatin Organisation MOdifier) domain
VKESNFKPFQVNDRVWLEGTNLNLPYLTKKLAPRRFGPFRVVAKISDIAYRLELPPKWKIHDSFHASLLTPYKEMEKHGPNILEPPPDIIKGEPEWEVEQILDHQQIQNKTQYLIRWKDYSPTHDSWEAESDINAPILLSNYLTKLAHSAAHSAIQNAPNRTTPIAETMQELQKPRNQSTQTWTNGKRNAPSVSSTAPSVSSAVNTRRQSARLTKPTVQYQSYGAKRARRMYIRTLTTVEEEAPAIDCMSSLPPTPSPTPSSPIPDSSNDASEWGTSPDNGRLAPPRQPAFYPAWPGSTCPVTPQSEDAGGNRSRDDGSNRDNGDANDSDKENWAPFTNRTLGSDSDDNNDPYCTANLHLLWRLANGARKYWLVHKHWPVRLDEHINGLLGVLTIPRPDNPANIEQYLLDIPALFRALKAWEGDLEEYTNSKDPMDRWAPAVDAGNISKKRAQELQEEDQVARDREQTRQCACIILQENSVPLAWTAV